MKSLFGFADGGYTGPGARLEAAGVVHRGEYVFDARIVDRIGLSTLEAIHKGRRGYVDGGFVDPGATLRPQREQFTTPASVKRAMAAELVPTVVFSPNIINQAPNTEVATREVPDGRGGKREEILIREAFVQGATTRQGQQAMNQQRVATR